MNPAKQAPYKSRKPKAHQLKVGAIYVQESTTCGQSKDSSSDDSFCLQIKVQHIQASVKNTPTPAHMTTNLAYWLKQHQTRNLYLRARLDTCADVNIMPASVYKLVFKDPTLRKLIPSKLEIGTYTNDMVTRMLISIVLHAYNVKRDSLRNHYIRMYLRLWSVISCVDHLWAHPSYIWT